MVRQVRAFAMGVAFAAVAVGFAYAVPQTIRMTAQTVPDTEPEVEVVQNDAELQPVEGTQTESGRVPDPDEDEGDGGASGGRDNHGKVVSTAAHCPVKGRAHGELVSAIAKDKDATVADAEAACEAALAEQAAGEQKGKPAHAGRPENAGKPEKAPRPEKAPKPAKAPTAESGPPEKATKPEKPAPSGNGKSVSHGDAEVVESEVTEVDPGAAAGGPGNAGGNGQDKAK